MSCVAYIYIYIISAYVLCCRKNDVYTSRLSTHIIYTSLTYNDCLSILAYICCVVAQMTSISTRCIIRFIKLLVNETVMHEKTYVN